MPIIAKKVTKMLINDKGKSLDEKNSTMMAATIPIPQDPNKTCHDCIMKPKAVPEMNVTRMMRV